MLNVDSREEFEPHRDLRGQCFLDGRPHEPDQEDVPEQINEDRNADGSQLGRPFDMDTCNPYSHSCCIDDGSCEHRTSNLRQNEPIAHIPKCRKQSLRNVEGNAGRIRRVEGIAYICRKSEQTNEVEDDAYPLEYVVYFKVVDLESLSAYFDLMEQQQWQ